MSDQQAQDEQTMADIHYSESAPRCEAWKDNLRPVTIFQLLKAESSPSFGDKSIVIEGKNFSAVILVAHVVSTEPTPAGASYQLEDGTGRMYARKTLDSLTHLHGLNPKAEREERAQISALEHTYVEVIGTLQRGGWGCKLEIKSITPVHDYHQVMYHILSVIHCNILIQQYVPKSKPYSSDMDFESSEQLVEDLEDDMVVDDVPAMLPSQPVLPSSFSPLRQQPYAALEPLQRAIVRQMYHKRDTHVSIAELAQIIQASYMCTQIQFDLALQALLTEAYLTSPLDDGFVVLTPRY